MALTKYSLIFAVVYIVIHANIQFVDYVIHYYFDGWAEKYYLRKDRYTDPVSRQKKSRVVVRWGFNIFYYSLTSISGYLLIKNTSFLPPILGGNGSVYSLSEHRYLDEATLGMEIYYCIQFGKHVGRFFCHVFIQA